MKSLSLSKPLVLVVVGLPGSGKSFFAKQFSETFGAPDISYDRLRNVITPLPIPNKDEQEAISKLVDYQMKELLKTQKTIILDGIGLTRVERVELRKAVRDRGYEVLLIWVQTDPATAKYRSMKRSPKKADDAYNVSLTAEQYDQLEKRFSLPSSNEPSVVISGKHTYATQARIVLKKLVVPREEQVQNQQIVGHQGRRPESDKRAPRRSVLVR